MSTSRGRGDAMLPGAGFRDHTALAHSHRQQGLAERIVDLVGAGVVQVFSLQVNLGAAALLAEALRVIKWRGAANVILEQIGQLGVERRVSLGLLVRHHQLVQGPHQRLGHVPATEWTKASRRIGDVAAGGLGGRGFVGGGGDGGH